MKDKNRNVGRGEGKIEVTTMGERAQGIRHFIDSASGDESVKFEGRPPLPPPQRHSSIYDAKVIRTDKGDGLLVESCLIGGKSNFVMRHLGNAHAIAVGFEGAVALRQLLNEWIEAKQTQEWVAAGDNMVLAK